ncbi:MAG: type 4a pilus biogenesis protein PilO [Minisyncoccia bacterium]|jgi:Tfp pilus assembly protein PilO
MKASTKRILSILFSAFFLMATLVVYGSLIQPEIQNATKLQALVASKTQLFNNQKAAVTQVANLISQFQSAAKLQQTVGLAVPIGPSITQALNQWQAVAQASQVGLQSLNIQPGQSPAASKTPATQSLVKPLLTIPTKVEATGNYGSLKQFINAIETNARVMNVVDFDFKSLSNGQPSGGGANANPIFSLQLDVNAFYQGN